MFGDDGAFAGLPLVTNGGSTRLYEIVAEKGEPGFEKLIPDERPEAYKVKIAVAMEIPREAHLIYSVDRSEGHTSELQSLMRRSYAVFCLKKKHTQIVHAIDRNNIIMKYRKTHTI